MILGLAMPKRQPFAEVSELPRECMEVWKRCQLPANFARLSVKEVKTVSGWWVYLRGDGEGRYVQADGRASLGFTLH